MNRDRSQRTGESPRADRRSEAPGLDPPLLESRVLLGPDGRLHLRHKGQTYELRETRFGKLILTK